MAFAIYVVNANGTGPVNITDHDAAEDADGAQLVNLTESAGGGFLPAWSPDGTRIAFESTRDGNPEVYVMNADGSGVTRITDHPWTPCRLAAVNIP